MVLDHQAYKLNVKQRAQEMHIPYIIEPAIGIQSICKRYKDGVLLVVCLQM